MHPGILLQLTSSAAIDLYTMDENRKRNLSVDNDMIAAISSKRGMLRRPQGMTRSDKGSNIDELFISAAFGDSGASDPQDRMIKMLCPSAVAGSIIGRAGAVISQLNNTTGARIKVSQNKEFFPTTNDRVIVISGSIDAISAALVELVTKMIEVCMD